MIQSLNLKPQKVYFVFKINLNMQKYLNPRWGKVTKFRVVGSRDIILRLYWGFDDLLIEQ